MSEQSFSFDPETARQQFVEASEHVANLSDQNRRFDLIPEVTDADLKAVATEWLAVEQQNTLAYLQANANSAPYRQLGQRLLELEEASRPSDEQRAQIQASKEAIDREVEFVIQIAPLGEEQTRQMAEEKKQALDGELESMGPPPEVLEEQVALNALFEMMSEPWPVPKATSLDAIISSNREIIRQIIDEIPVEPTLAEHQSPDVRAAREAHSIYERELTNKIINFLADNSGRVISVRELCEAMYSPAVLANMRQEDARALITTALGPKVKGPVVRKALVEKGFTLQYGRRIERMKDGDRTRTSVKRIYRVIPLGEFNEVHTQRSEDNGKSMLWEVLPEHIELMEENQAAQSLPQAEQAGEDVLTPGQDIAAGEAVPSKKRRFEEVADLLISSPGQQFTYEDIAGVLYAGEEVDGKQMRNRLAVLFKNYGDLIEQAITARGFTLTKEKAHMPGYQKKVMVLSCSSVGISEIGQNPAVPEERPAEPEPQPEPAPQAGSTTPGQAASKKENRRGLPSWESDFQDEVDIAIAAFSGQGYIQGGNLFPLLEAKGNGAAKTLLEHMLKEGTLSKTKFREKIIKASDLVAFTASRNNRSLFRDEKMRARCQEIISASLSRHYAKQQQAQTSA